MGRGDRGQCEGALKVEPRGRVVVIDGVVEDVLAVRRGGVDVGVHTPGVEGSVVEAAKKT